MNILRHISGVACLQSCTVDCGSSLTATSCTAKKKIIPVHVHLFYSEGGVRKTLGKPIINRNTVQNKSRIDTSCSLSHRAKMALRRRYNPRRLVVLFRRGYRLYCPTALCRSVRRGSSASARPTAGRGSDDADSPDSVQAQERGKLNILAINISH